MRRKDKPGCEGGLTVTSATPLTAGVGSADLDGQARVPLLRLLAPVEGLPFSNGGAGRSSVKGI